jgi:aldehyde dehydrogenase (NAD+)
MSTDNDTIYIGGQWVTPSSTSKIEIRSPATGEPVGSVIAAGERDVDALNAVSLANVRLAR